MAHRTDAAGARGERRHFAVGPPLAELLEAAELREVEARALHLACVGERERDAGVALDAGDGVDGDDAAHGVGTRVMGSFRLGLQVARWLAGPGASVAGHAPKRVTVAGSGVRPSISSARTYQIASADGGQPGT